MSSDAEGFMSIDMEGDARDGARNVILFAQAMLSHARSVLMPHNGQPTCVRVGVHTGSVVSGLIGSKLPKFSLFGDTMNTSSRMESTSRPGCIQVSESTYTMLDEDQRSLFEATGGVEVKGKGLMPTYIYQPSEAELQMFAKAVGAEAASAEPPKTSLFQPILTSFQDWSQSPAHGSSTHRTSAIFPSLPFQGLDEGEAVGWSSMKRFFFNGPTSTTSLARAPSSSSHSSWNLNLDLPLGLSRTSDGINSQKSRSQQLPSQPGRSAGSSKRPSFESKIKPRSALLPTVKEVAEEKSEKSCMILTRTESTDNQQLPPNSTNRVGSNEPSSSDNSAVPNSNRVNRMAKSNSMHRYNSQISAIGRVNSSEGQVEMLSRRGSKDTPSPSPLVQLFTQASNLSHSSSSQISRSVTTAFVDKGGKEGNEETEHSGSHAEPRPAVRRKPTKRNTMDMLSAAFSNLQRPLP